MKIPLNFSRKKTHSFFDDTKLQIDQIKNKKEKVHQAIIYLKIKYF